jgi:hypothetical protein
MSIPVIKGIVAPGVGILLPGACIAAIGKEPQKRFWLLSGIIVAASGVKGMTGKHGAAEGEEMIPIYSGHISGMENWPSTSPCASLKSCSIVGHIFPGIASLTLNIPYD